MSTTGNRQFLQRDLVEIDHLMAISADDPVMALALKNRRESLARELQQAPSGPPTPRTVLFFAGPPVLGSQGIDAEFAASALRPFLEMVKTQYSAQKHGKVGARGPRKDEAEAKLMLTGLPRGSFGLELSQPQYSDFVAAEQLSDSLLRLADVLASAADNDERFAFSLSKVSPRVLPRLKEFLDVVATQNAFLCIETGEIKVDLPLERVTAARDRVGDTKTNEREVTMEGVFRGATLDSWRFDFRTATEQTISGRIAEEVDDAQAEAMLPLTNHPCKATFRETIVTTRDGAQHSRFELLGLTPPARLQSPST